MTVWLMKAWLGAAGVAALAAAAQAATGYKVLDKVPGPDGGWDYATFDSAGNRALVTRGTTVLAVDAATKAVTTIGAGQRLHKALPVNGGKELLLTNGGDNTAKFVDAKTGADIASVATGKGPDSAALDAKTGLALVMGHGGGDVTFIDTKTHKAVGTVMVGGALEEAAVDGAGRAYVNAENNNDIGVIDIKTQKLVTKYPLKDCDGPTGLAYDAQDGYLIAACNGATAILKAKTGEQVATLATGKGADGVAYDSKQHLAFVPAGRDGTLSVIAFDHGKPAIIDTVTTERGARTIAEDERTGRVYLPSATFSIPEGGTRPVMQPGSFHMLIVGK
jgi:DNA-binding beta-propeller fold protein YncE